MSENQRTDTGNSFYSNNIRKKLRSDYRAQKRTGTALSIAVSVAGLILGIAGVAWSDSFAPWVLAILVIIDAVVVFCLGIWSTVYKRFSDGQNELRELNCDDIIASMQSEIDALKLKAEEERDCYNEKLSSRNDSERLIVAQLETVLRSKAEAMNDL